MAQREQIIILNNTTDLLLTLTSKHLDHGEFWSDAKPDLFSNPTWTDSPPNTIEPHTTVAWGSQSNGFATGTAGSVKYKLSPGGDEMVINWSVPFIGVSTIHAEVNGFIGLSQTTRIDWTGHGKSPNTPFFNLSSNDKPVDEFQLSPGTNSQTGSVGSALNSVDFAQVAATHSGAGRVDLFARNSAKRISRTFSTTPQSSAWPTAWAELPVGQFLSGPTACQSSTGKDLHVFGRGTDNRIWRAHSGDGGASWALAWAAIGTGTFQSAPAAAISADGKIVHVFGLGMDQRIWRARSVDGGATWNIAWAPISSGIFTSAPCAAVSSDGQKLHVFGRGPDNRIWRAFSADAGNSWLVAWAPIGDGIFHSAPATALTGDGKGLHVFGRGTDNRIWRAFSPNGGGSWAVGWTPVGDGKFVSTPAATLFPNGQELHLFGVGNDMHVWHAASLDGGGSWAVGWTQVPGGTVF